MKILQQLSFEQETKIAASKTRFEKIVTSIAAIMENTRYTYGYSLNKFANLLGLTNYQYTRFLKKGTSDYVIRAIFKFCYIFDYDLQTLAKPKHSFVQDMDEALMEIGVSFGSVPDELIQEFADKLKESQEMHPADKRRAVAALQTYIERRQGFYDSLKSKDFSEVSDNGKSTDTDTESAMSDSQTGNTTTNDFESF